MRTLLGMRACLADGEASHEFKLLAGKARVILDLGILEENNLIIPAGVICSCTIIMHNNHTTKYQISRHNISFPHFDIIFFLN